ncbi:hypothetical protein, partial [Escherichia coli]|uniref:hypothetical protein n=1 Tax=Escherichia coli TaxID=562 RepID=UPI001BDBA1A3
HKPIHSIKRPLQTPIFYFYFHIYKTCLAAEETVAAALAASAATAAEDVGCTLMLRSPPL